MLLRLRLYTRRAVAELVYSVADHYFGSGRSLEQSVVQRGDGVHTQTLQLTSLLRRRRDVRLVADRCRQPPLRLWALGVDVNVTATDGCGHVELPGGLVLEDGRPQAQ